MLTRSQTVVVAVLAAGVILLVSQFRPGRNASQPPAADLSTPERALKSYWTLREWVRRNRAAEPNAADTSPTVAQVMSAVTAGTTRESFVSRPGALDPLGWTLERVDLVTDTQAVATARIRNLARNPATVTPTPIELFEPTSGNQLQYVLYKDGAVWKVAEVWRVDSNGRREKVR